MFVWPWFCKNNTQSFSIATLLLIAIFRIDATITKILLKDGNANPNVVDNENHTALMYCVLLARGNLSIMKLLTKYGFDYAKLVNKRENKTGRTVFHTLCDQERTDDPIACLKYLCNVCNKIPDCSINILAKNDKNMC